MERPTKFEHSRWIGDRRTQVRVAASTTSTTRPSSTSCATGDAGLNGVAYTCFSPDTLAEARNRGYKPYKRNGSGPARGFDDPED